VCPLWLKSTRVLAKKEMKYMREENQSGEVIVKIDMNLIRKGLGTIDTDTDRVYYSDSDVVEIGRRVDAKFKNTNLLNTTAELSGWCPAAVWIHVTWHVALFASRLFRQVGNHMVEVI